MKYVHEVCLLLWMQLGQFRGSPSLAQEVQLRMGNIMLYEFLPNRADVKMQEVGASAQFQELDEKEL